jgi:hypothetical protein
VDDVQPIYQSCLAANGVSAEEIPSLLASESMQGSTHHSITGTNHSTGGMMIFTFKPAQWHIARAKQRIASQARAKSTAPKQYPEIQNPMHRAIYFKRIDVSCCSSPRDNDRHNDITPVPVVENAMTEVIRCAVVAQMLCPKELPVIHAAEAMEYEMEISNREKHHRKPCTMLKIKNEYVKLKWREADVG